jgi:hypothetical protein
MRSFTTSLTMLATLAFGGGSAQQKPVVTPQPQSSTGTYYVDCSAPVNGNGSQSSPWNTLSSPNAFTFTAGNRLLLKRGTTCQGTLFPLGSGSSGAPIIMDAYGVGAQPVIDGGFNQEALLLSNQQYWEIRNLEITGGYQYGILIWGDVPNSNLNHFRLVNLNVHGANFTSINPFDSGEIYINPVGMHEVVNDVLIDGVSTHDSHVSEGIFIQAGGNFGGEVAACSQQLTPAQYLGKNITIQNSTGYHLNGDGILVLAVKDGLMQNNVVHDTFGMLWEWCCHSCTLQYNESYANHTLTPWDGGDFDIDIYNKHNVLQYNYGHDSDGYCVQFYSSDPIAPDRDNVFRYNICSNNGRNGTIQPQGEVLVDGYVNGVQVYNNTFYWNPAVNSAAAFLTYAYPGTDTRIFENNIIYSAVPGMIQTPSGYTLDNNIYWTTSSSPPTWQWNGVTYTSFSAYQAGSGQDAHSYYTDPMLNNPTYHGSRRPTTAFTLQAGSPARGTGANVCLGISGCSMGKHDFFGNPLPNGSGYDIGTDQAP